MKVSSKEFGRLANVSIEALRQAVKNKKLIRDNQYRYDLTNEVNISYLLNKGLTLEDINNFAKSISGHNLENIEKITDKSSQSLKNKGNNEEKETEILDEKKFTDITGLPAYLMNLTIKELVIEYDEPVKLKFWADVLYKLLQAQEREQKIKERDLELIEKDFVMKYIFKYIELLNLRLLDYPDSAVDNLTALIKTNENNVRIKIIEEMTKDFSMILTETKESIKREINKLLNKHLENNNE
ncbi:hypothetical protein Bint_1536 [Brachyspira intermedia PWS/A]|uniref:Uncharacterized protein n=1 Tax=Brachyspira intermedia (strain ATCC 51140 / PWS/A) TaxID=1045858 RepID=G0EHZ6_BRAIP|nr:hypothetical protein [Brachyspira intermedia]AEM22155.1 hypothetical protein Bint_1536 [Brachyspira intermedia PWS/A]